MKTFLAVYVGSAKAQAKSDWDSMSEEERTKTQAAGMTAWNDWATRHDKSIIESGGPLGKTKRASPEGISDTSNNMVAYVIVQAQNQYECRNTRYMGKLNDNNYRSHYLTNRLTQR